jgi:DNA-binding NarL/FixJ family response regulator
MINLLIADNQTLTREGLATVLGNIDDIHIIGCTSASRELDQMIATHRPKVLIIDLEQELGLNDIRNIYRRFPFTTILVMFNFLQRALITEMMYMGIKGFVSKCCSKNELTHAIYSTAKGQQYLCERASQIIVGEDPELSDSEALTSLSSRESEIINLIAKGLSNKEIAEKLFLSIFTIKAHRRNIKKKLGFSLKNALELAHMVNN